MTFVLAAVDLTQMGRRVADRGRLVAERLELPLTLMHVVEPLAEHGLEGSVAAMVADHRSRKVDELVAWVAGRTDTEVTGVVVKGSPVWEIIRLGRKAEVTVVGASTDDSVRIGPVSRRVAELGHGDVLVVRRQPRGPYRKALAAVDFSNASSQVMETAVGVTGSAASVTVAHACSTRFDAQTVEAGLFEEELESLHAARRRATVVKLDSLVEGTGAKTVVGMGSPMRVMSEVARKRAADLVVVASRGRGATKATLLGTVAEGVAAAMPCDVWISRVPGGFRRP